MFYQYAVDPRCFAEWDNFRLLRGQFGWKQGRLISKFPKKWKKIVHDYIQQNERDGKKMTFIQKQRVTDELAKKIFINSGCNFEANQCDWLNNAINCSTAFRAILAKDNPSNHTNVLVASELTPDDDLWKNEFTDIVLSTPDDLCKCVELLLKESEKVLFVDPYFFRRDNDKENMRWIITLKKFLEVENKNKTVDLQYHIEISDGEFIKEPDKRKGDFETQCDKIKKILSKGRIITIFRWKKKEHIGDKFHARYILTDLGGVWFDVGLDKGKSGETTNVARLEGKVWNNRLNSFKEGSQVYDFVDKIEVIGE